MTTTPDSGQLSGEYRISTVSAATPQTLLSSVLVKLCAFDGKSGGKAHVNFSQFLKPSGLGRLVDDRFSMILARCSQ